MKLHNQGGLRMGILQHWYRLLYIIFCLAGIAVYIVIFALKPAGTSIPFTMICFFMAPLAFFVGTIVYNALKMSPKTDSMSNYFLLGTGAAATILFCIGADAVYKAHGLVDIVKRAGTVIVNDGAGNYGPDIMGDWYALALVSFAFVGQLIVFGLMPLVKGISKTLGATPEPIKQKKIAEPPPPPPPPAPEVKTRKPRAPRTPKVTE